MKKLISSLMLLSMILMNNPAKAIVGIASDSEATAIAGLALMDLSQIFVIDSHTHHRRTRRGWQRTTYITYRIVTIPAFLIAGLVLLDENGQAEISADLTADQIAKAKLLKDEVQAFKDEIEEINAIKDVVASEIAGIENEEERMEVAGSLWTEYASELSENAAVALAKLSTLE